MKKNTKKTVIIGVLTAASIALYLLEIPFAFMFPAYGFLKLDFHLLPGAIGAVFMGPVAGIIIIGLSNLMHMIFGLSTTMGVGETVNFIAGISFIVPMVSLMKKSGVLKVWHMCIATAITIIAINLYNYFAAFPIYSVLFNFPGFNEPEYKLGFAFTAGIWFNLIKWGGMSGIVLLVYRNTKDAVRKLI